jgi:protein-S-isoprenylcysteine O-methyltransferase Ste14
MDKLISLPPPVIALLLVGMGFGLDLLIPGLPALQLPLLGIVLMATGVFLAALALLNFRSFRTTAIPHGNPTALVTTGPYVWTRNPMYLGVLTALCGFAFYFGGLPLFIAPPAFFVLIGQAHIPYEESKLSSRFGEAYAKYRRLVERWL